MNEERAILEDAEVVRGVAALSTTASQVDRVRSALRSVYDPELGIDIVSLGLIYAINESPEGIVIDMTLTTPGCPVSDGLPEQAEQTVADVLGPHGPTAKVRLVWAPPWTPERLEEGAAAKLGVVRR